MHATAGSKRSHALAGNPKDGEPEGARRGSLRQRGFTLLELVVVIAIIGLLSTIVVIRVGGFLPQARKTAAIATMQTILKASEIYSTRHGSYPETIAAILDATDEQGRPSPLLPEYPLDPWKRDFVYELTPTGPRVTCLGSDGEPGGSEDNEAEDIVLPAPRGE